MEHAFRLRGTVESNSSKILLVDDVLTTGTAIESAARAFKVGGTKSVDVVIFASAK